MIDKRIQDRDLEVLNLINLCKVCTKDQIQQTLFSEVTQNVCIRRLKLLSDLKLVKRSRFNISKNSNQYVYYIDKKPSKRLLQHELEITNFILKLYKSNITILNVYRSKCIDNVIPDAIIEIKDKEGKRKRYFIEMQLSGKVESCVMKYKEIKDKIIKYTDYEVIPKLIVITDLPINKIRIRDIKVKYSSINNYDVDSLLFD